jgi:hypothetical protein
MKATTFLAATAILFVFSCQKAKDVPPTEPGLNLQAPSGQAIAAGVDDLKVIGLKALANKEAQTGFTLTSIDYLPVAKGYAALVHYRLLNGSEGTFAVVSGVKLQAPGKDGGTLYEDNSKQFLLTCTPYGYCVCRAYLYYNSNNQTITYSCGCESCFGFVSSY